MFTWVPFFTELGKALLEYENRQSDLVAMLRESGVQGGLVDRDRDGKEFGLEEIDPFTFLAQIIKHGEEKRTGMLAYLKSRLNIAAQVPDDFMGVPNADARKSWYFGYKADRKSTDIPQLWKLSRQMAEDHVTPDTFDSCLQIRQVGRPKLTQGMFWLRADKYLPIDSQTRGHLEKAGINPEFESYSGYAGILARVKEQFPEKPFFEISHEAWQENQVDPPKSAKYWLYAPGNNARQWESFHQMGIMAIGWDYLGDLNQYPNKLAIAEAIQKHDEDPSSKKNNATSCYSFVRGIQLGDFVFAKQGRERILGFGKVISEYEFDDSRENFKHVRKVEWFKKGDWKVDPDDRFALKTLTEVTKYGNFVRKLKKIVNSDPPPAGGSSGGKTPKFWWLNANPKIWDLSKMPVGSLQTYTSHTPDGTKRQRFKYFAELTIGDQIIGYVASPVREVVAICKVTKPLSSDNNEFEFKKVKQYAETISWSELQGISELAACEPIKNNQGSLFSLTADEFNYIHGLLEERNIPTSPAVVEPYGESDALNDLFMPLAQFRDTVELLKYKKNIILQGPPGVGKTFMAKRLAYVLMGEKADHRIQSVQFHQSYSYEDFIQGIRPNSSGGFVLKNGLFFRFCRRAAREPEKSHVFIIDEINRGNLSKVFGEAMMLIEADKRGHEVLLAYSEDGESFTIPPNIYLIGTMNTADRSLAMVDYALRRRFCFVDVLPAFSTEEGTKRFEEQLQKCGVSTELLSSIVSKMRAVNAKISEDTKSLGKEYQLGHSYFCGASSKYDTRWFKQIVQYELAPLLREYWFDAREKAESHIRALLG